MNAKKCCVKELSLDFHLLPEFEFTALFICLPEDLKTKLERFPETSERIEGALMFAL
jgi:hypothetical protein